MKAARWPCTMAGLAVWTAAVLVSGAAFAAAERSVSGARAARATCTPAPAPDAKKSTAPEGHAKPSSYAPQPRSPNRAYGAPIQKPILSRSKRAKGHTYKAPGTTPP